MTDIQIMEGKPCLPPALMVATVGFVIFAGINLAVVLLPEELLPGHYILGSRWPRFYGRR